MSRLRLPAGTVALLLLLTYPVTVAVFGQAAEPEDAVVRRAGSTSANSQGDQAGTPDQGVALNMQIVGRQNLGGRGFNADVWVHNTTAYVGQWGFGDAQHPDRCPSGVRSGVKVIDVSNPANPQLIATLQNPPLTTAEDVQVLRYTSGPYAGRDIAMVGIQACFRRDPSNRRGLQLFDVTNPRSPVELGFLDIGMASIGVHEFWAVARPDLSPPKVLALLAVPFSMRRDERTPPRGDVRIADVTDPAHPLEIANWSSNATGLTANAPDGGFGCFPFFFAHGAFSNAAGSRAYISHWDLGTVILDISTPSAPVFLGRTPYPANAEGDGHSVDLAEGERFLLTADEVIPPNSNCQAPDRHTEKGWGYLRVFDLTTVSNPTQVAAFKTSNAASPNRPRKGDYSIHNPFVRGPKAYLSWYSDGVRVVDISDPTRPLETAFLVPPSVRDPLHVLPFAPEVWGVVVDARGCIYLSEMNFGLYVVSETPVTTCR